MSLVQTALDLSYPVRKQGRTFGGPRCPTCGIGTPHSNRFCIFFGKDDKERWKCQACGSHGDIVDFIVAATGCSTADAFARTRNGVRFAPSDAKEPCPPQRPSRPSSAMSRSHIQLLREGLSKHPDDKVFAYLRGRCISSASIEKMVEADQLRFLPSDVHLARKMIFEVFGGQDVAENCGLLTAPKKWPAAAFRPVVGILPKDCAVEFRMVEESETFKKALRFGSLNYPYFIKAEKEVKIVEGLIDVLSCIELGETRSIMGIPGTNSWQVEWFSSMKAHGYSTFHTGLDNDEPGRDAMAKISGELATLELNVIDDPAPAGNDWNDYLKTLRGASSP